MYKATKVRWDDGGGSLSVRQEVHLFFKQNFQILEKSCRWETHDVMEIPFDLTDEHASEALVQLLVIGRTPSHRRLTCLDSEAASAINPLTAVRISFQQTHGAVAECNKGPVIHGATLK